MPGIAQKSNVCAGSSGTVYHSLVGNGAMPYNSFNGSSVSTNGFWSKHRDDVSYNQLQKFWCELTTQARQKLMKIDKQTFLEHARKNMYCSRCNGLLLEGFLQIVMYGKSIQQDTKKSHYNGRTTDNENCGNLCNDNECQDDVIDPSLHPWGGLTTSRDGMLTLLGCYLHSKSLKRLQNVFNSACARERERKLLYPDACGGGGRGWISQGMTGYGRGHGTRETCALHTARLSVETLVDFWSALGEESRQSLLRMKEEDFIERLMYRFDSKKFCRDCRRNVIREFKELKELNRMRKNPCCTSRFCVEDSVFQYEVSHDTVKADWQHTFLDACGIYHHFEWAIGTGEGKFDISDFKNVGLSLRAQVNGLDLSGLIACYITLRAWKMDGRCNELCVKARALGGQQCVHCRLAVGDGYVAITIGENIRRFFEHAEEAEEEEDDDSMDKDGNEFDGLCSRPQKHAKSPELAREFLLDAATVIFKEQVEKALREGTSRQNAHSIFVCLALKLLEERLHVACKEIITLEKQMKLLEEEEKEKREEEERKERRKIKDREKKLRRKEKLREKDNKETICADSNGDDLVLSTGNGAEPCVDEDVTIGNTRYCARETEEATHPPSPLSPDFQDDQYFTGHGSTSMENPQDDILVEEFGNARDFNTSLPYNRYRYARRKPRFCKDNEQDFTSKWSDKRRKDARLSESELTNDRYESRSYGDGFQSAGSMNCFSKQLRINAAKYRCDSHMCSCNHHNDYTARAESHMMKSSRESKFANKLESSCDNSTSDHRGKCTHVDCASEINGRVKTNVICSNSPVRKKVWEPLDPQRKCVQGNSDSVVTWKPTDERTESDQVSEPFRIITSSESADISVKTNSEDNDPEDLTRSGNETFHSREKTENCIKLEEAEDDKLCFITRSPLRTVNSLMSSSSNSESCSSCISEGDSNSSSSNCQHPESTSTSDSEECSQTSEGRDVLCCLESRLSECHKVVADQITQRQLDANRQESASGTTTNLLCSLPTETAALYCESGKKVNVAVDALPQSVPPAMIYNQKIQYPIYQAPTMGYYHQAPVYWAAGSTNGLMSFHYPNHYLIANGFGYDLNTTNATQFMQILPPPLINPVHMPVFPTMTQENVVCTKETTVSTEGHSAETAIVADDWQNGKCEKADKGFSLFHFGGPVALSAGFRAEQPLTLKGEGGLPQNSSEMSPSDGNDPCNRRDSIEEYNLFAATNGIKFSIF